MARGEAAGRDAMSLGDDDLGVGSDLGHAAVDRALSSAEVLIVVGAGGVGKTTMAAALGARAARDHGRRVLVVTVDPARRLTDALGIEGDAIEPVLVPMGEGSGRLRVAMLDMSHSWDEMVRAVAPDDDTADALLANSLYRALTTRFVQSHDYIALDRLAEPNDDRVDLIVVDTPPSHHALDVLDAPERLTAFFDSRLLRWVTAPYRSRLAQAAAAPFLALAERLLGGQFLAAVAEFFWLFSRLQPGFAARAAAVRARLGATGTEYVVVTTAEPSALSRTAGLLDALGDRDHAPSLLVHNRAAPAGVDDGSEITDPSLAAAVEALVDGDDRVADLVAGRGLSDTAALGVTVIRVPWRSGALASVSELADLVALRS